MKKTLLLLLASICILLPSQADAGFKTEEHLHFLTNVKLTGPDQSGLYLAHLIERRVFVYSSRRLSEQHSLSYSFKSKGLVLGIHGKLHEHIPLPSGTELKELQDKGLLPNPLPPIKFTWRDYVSGYSLWIILLLFPLAMKTPFIRNLIQWRRRPALNMPRGKKHSED